MISLIKNLWKTLNKVRVLEINYYVDEPIVPDCEQTKENQGAIKYMVDLNRQKLKLEENERKSKEILAKYIKTSFEKQGLLIAKKQLEKEVEKSWQNLKDSRLVNGFNEFQPAIKEIL